MLIATRVLQYVIALAIISLGVHSFRVYRRYRDRPHARMAITLGLLASVSLIGFMNRIARDVTWLGSLSLVAFIGSGYAFMLLRDTFIPISKRMRALVTIACVTAVGLGISIRWPAGEEPELSNLQYAVLLLVVGGWFAAVVEPVVTFWRAGNGRPAVQRARMRALSAAFGGMVLVLAIGLALGRVSQGHGLRFSLQLVMLIVLPVLWVAITPPGWIRRIWRAKEERKMMDALRELVLFTPDVNALATRALGSMIGWLGADGGCVIGPDGSVLATQSLDEDLVRVVRGGDGFAPPSRLDDGRYVVSVPFSWGEGQGSLVMVSGPFTPLFGTEEVRALNAYATMLSAALERMRLNEELLTTRERSRAQLEEAQAIAHVGSWMWRVGDDGIEWSAEMYRIFAIEPGTPVRRETMWAPVCEEDHATARRLFTELLRGGDPICIDYKIRRGDGDVRVIQTRAHVTADGNDRVMIGTAQDVTDLRRAEEVLRESERTYAEAYERERAAVERLEAIDEMKNAFLAAVSHELRTPLTSVIGFAQTIQQHGSSLSEAERVLFMDRLLVNAQRLDRLLNDILDLDRLGRGIIEPRRNEVDFAELVERVVADLEIADEREISLDLERFTADIDAAKVERIVENLLRNVQRHTPAGTPVWVRASVEPEGLMLVVDDAGPGVPAELRSSVFEPFTRGNPSDHSPGVGVGLSLVARFACIHGGRAWVEEAPRGGASFRVFLGATTQTLAEGPGVKRAS